MRGYGSVKMRGTATAATRVQMVICQEFHPASLPSLLLGLRPTQLSVLALTL